MRKGIIVVSFGTSYPEARKTCIESVENKIAESFPNCEVVRAFTSYRIIQKLKDRDGLHVKTVDQALNDFYQRGITSIHVQPLHLIPGFEYEKVTRAVDEWQKSGMDITLGKTLLHDDESISSLSSMVVDMLPKHEDGVVNVLMGHGTDHAANEQYTKLQKNIRELRHDIFLANVEGYPELEDIEASLEGYSYVNIRPLMIVAGDHALNDMAGDDDSWKEHLLTKGYKVNPILKGLGQEEVIQERFVDLVKHHRKW